MNALRLTMRRAAFLTAASCSKRLSAAALSRPALVYLQRRCFGAQRLRVDDETDHDSNRFSKEEYRQFLDKMTMKVNKIESSMENLKETFAKNASGTRDASKMNAFFEESGKHKQVISQGLTEIQSLLRLAGAGKIYAVDAPDGESDGHVLEELWEVQHIFDDEEHGAKKTKNSMNEKRKEKEEILKQRASDPEHW